MLSVGMVHRYGGSGDWRLATAGDDGK